jgi:hypothetical protein
MKEPEPIQTQRRFYEKKKRENVSLTVNESMNQRIRLTTSLLLPLITLLE